MNPPELSPAGEWTNPPSQPPRRARRAQKALFKKAMRDHIRSLKDKERIRKSMENIVNASLA